MILENEITHLKFKLNLQNKKSFSSEATMPRKISSSLFFTFSEKIIDFPWRRLLIILRTSAKFSCWVVSYFYFSSLPQQRPGTILVMLEFIFLDGSLWCIWLCLWHSTCLTFVIRNYRHLIFPSSSLLLLSIISDKILWEF